MSSLFQLVAPWEVKPMAELCSGGDSSIQTGPFGSQLHASDYVHDGIPCVMPQDIRDGRVSTENIARITGDDHQRLNRFHLRKGDIVYPRRGDISKRALIGEREAGWLCGTGCLRIRPNVSSTDPQFLAYYLSHPDVCAWIEGNAVGATMPHLNTGLAGAIPIVCPPLEEQREIAAILGALDDKIELNRKTAATLEEMARVLYRSWFITFDPVHAKAAGRAPAHMDTQTADLFPDSFGEDGLPEGWDMVPLKNHVSVLRGLSYKGAGLCEKDEGIPLHNLNSVFEGGGYKTSGIKYYRGDFKPRHEIIPGDLIVTNTEQGFDLLLMGHSALVPHHFGPIGLFSQHIYKVEPKSGSPLSREWLYLMLSVSPKGQEIRAYSNGTTVNMLPIDALEIPEVCTPPHEVIEAFDNAVKPMLARQESLEVENQTLATLRDTLLPRLMSGELRVGEAKEQVEEVV